jgi:hypothetical protein
MKSIGLTLTGPCSDFDCFCGAQITYRETERMWICSGCGVEYPNISRPLPNVAGFDSIRPEGRYDGKEKKQNRVHAEDTCSGDR